jgi:hypothetical protein
VRFTWRVWWAPPSLWRDELTWPNGETTVIIVRSDASLSYVSMHETLYTSEPLATPARVGAQPHNGRGFPTEGMHLPTIADRLEEFPLIRPQLPPSEWELTTLGDELYMGRAVRRVRATRRAGSSPAEDRPFSRSWLDLDDYEYLVDDDLQILVQLTGIADRLPIGRISADHINVDTLPAADTFAFDPPPGTRIAHVTQRT